MNEDTMVSIDHAFSEFLPPLPPLRHPSPPTPNLLCIMAPRSETTRSNGACLHHITPMQTQKTKHARGTHIHPIHATRKSVSRSHQREKQQQQQQPDSPQVFHVHGEQGSSSSGQGTGNACNKAVDEDARRS